jgi:hypothetical protein
VLEPRDVYERLEMLLGADVSSRVLGAAKHRYMLTPPWPEERVRAFEKRHAIELPGSYRRFLHRIGSAGAGPGYGLHEPGTWDEDPRRWEGTSHVAPLSTPFAHRRAWNLPRERLAALSAEADDDHVGTEYWSPSVTAGAMPIASLGSGGRVLLVVAGDERGRIWLDDRANENGLTPEAGLDFDAWYTTWLHGSEQLLMSPPKRRTTGRRGTRPPHTVRLEGAAAAAATRLRDKVHGSLAAGHPLELGKLGRFVPGPHPHFEQGIELRDAMIVRSPPHGLGDGHAVFAAVFEHVSTGAAVDVPGLFSAWRAAAASWDSYDYLGRRQVAEEPALLVIVEDPALPRAS